MKRQSGRNDGVIACGRSSPQSVIKAQVLHRSPEFANGGRVASNSIWGYAKPISMRLTFQ